MGLGLENAYGAGGAADALRQMLRDRFERQQSQHTQSIQDQELELRRQQAEQSAKIGDATLASLSDERAARAGQAREAALTSMTGRLTPGATLGANDASALPDYLKSSTPMQSPAAPDALAAGPQGGPIEGTIANSPNPQARTFRYTGTDKQNTDVEQKQLRGRLLADPNITTRERLAIQMEDAGLKVPAGVFEPKAANPLPVHDTANGLMRPNATSGVMEPVLDAKGKPVQGYHSPDAGASHYQLQPELDAKGVPTGRFFGYNGKTNKFELVSGATPTATKAAPGAAAAVTEERTKTEANDTLNQLDQAIENARNLIGPGAGRVSSVEQMVGNPDPSIQALGVKMKAAKMRMDHAITGSVRAGASPTLIKQWDNILGNNITPEALKGGVQAMREIIGGGASANMVKMTAPDGRALSVPAGKVAELEAQGAKRVP